MLMSKKRVSYTYIQTPQYDNIIRNGFRKVKEYDNYILFEKVVHNEVLYRECFHKFELYGASWANSPEVHRDGFHYISKEKRRWTRRKNK